MEKKKITIIIVCCCIVFAAVGGVFFARNVNQKKGKDLNIAFYGVSENLVEYIQQVAVENYEGNVNVQILDGSEVDIKKVDVVVAWEGDYTDKLKDKADAIPEKAISLLPNSLKKTSGNQLPLLVNPYVLDFYKSAALAENLNYPGTFSNLEKYLYDISGQVFTPIFCAGGNDEDLIAFIGYIVQSKWGVEGYSEYVEAIKRGEVLENSKVVSVLEMLVNWGKKGLIHPLWYMAKDSDITYFAGENQIGVLFNSLSKHRTLEYKVAQTFDMCKFPEDNNNVAHGIVGSKLVCMSFGAVGKVRKLFNALVDENNQANLSLISTLGPVALRGSACDIQADNARFYVASCEGGALITEPDSTAAEQIRSFLKQK